MRKYYLFFLLPYFMVGSVTARGSYTLDMLANLETSTCTVSMDKNDVLFDPMVVPFKEGESWNNGTVTVLFDNCPKSSNVVLLTEFTPVSLDHAYAVKNQGSGDGVYMNLEVMKSYSMVFTPLDGSTWTGYFEGGHSYKLSKTAFPFDHFQFTPTIVASKTITSSDGKAGHFVFPVTFMFKFS